MVATNRRTAIAGRLFAPLAPKADGQRVALLITHMRARFRKPGARPCRSAMCGRHPFPQETLARAGPCRPGQRSPYGETRRGRRPLGARMRKKRRGISPTRVSADRLVRPARRRPGGGPSVPVSPGARPQSRTCRTAAGTRQPHRGVHGKALRGARPTDAACAVVGRGCRAPAYARSAIPAGSRGTLPGPWQLHRTTG